MASLRSIFYKFYFFFVLLLLFFVWLVDWVTGWELQFFIFYLIPIGVATWFGDRISGIVTAFLSIFIWSCMRMYTGHTYNSLTVFVWNGCVRLAIFMLFAFFISRIKSLLEARQDFMHFIVHDLSTPFIMISSGLANLEDLTELDDSQKEMVSICKVATQRGLILVNSILDLAKLEAKRMQLEIKNTDINEAVELSLKMVAPFAKNMGVLLEKKVGSVQPDFFTDNFLLQRILINLLMNAVKASKKGSVVSVLAWQMGKNMMFSVIDEGRGLPAGASSNLFAKFIQFHKRADSAMAGTGLGLSFCKLAVEALGGTIKIESQENKGTKIVFVLPNKGRSD
jgi:signal transduction histidine kinase